MRGSKFNSGTQTKTKAPKLVPLNIHGGTCCKAQPVAASHAKAQAAMFRTRLTTVGLAAKAPLRVGRLLRVTLHAPPWSVYCIQTGDPSPHLTNPLDPEGRTGVCRARTLVLGSGFSCSGSLVTRQFLRLPKELRNSAVHQP